MYNGKLSRNRMALEFFHFGTLPARNKLVVSKSEKKSLYIMYAAELPVLRVARFARSTQKRGRRSRGFHDILRGQKWPTENRKPWLGRHIYDCYYPK